MPIAKSLGEGKPRPKAGAWKTSGLHRWLGLLRVAEIDLEIGGARAHAVAGHLVGGIRLERFVEPAGLVDDLAVLVEVSEAVIDVQLQVGRGADRDGDEEQAGLIAREFRRADGGVDSEIRIGEMDLSSRVRIGAAFERF